MKISGFTIVRNAEKFYFPIKESILSILPLVDEFIVALGDNEDATEAIVRSIDSPKIKIVHRVWDFERYQKGGRIMAIETDFALKQCTGDWCFYLQADEVMHENDLPEIRSACEKYLKDSRVEGFLFNYNHFWGDYAHVLRSHGAYKKEIRLIRNNIGAKSHADAISFRINGEQMLRVIQLEAEVYHYGWVRPPHVMQSKKKEQHTFYWGRKSKNNYAEVQGFDYGPMGRIPLFKGTHPAVMNELMKEISWKGQLNPSSSGSPDRIPMRHEKLKNRILSFFENKFFGGNQLFGHKNWKLIR